MKQYVKNLNILILVVLFLLGFALLYFLYYRQRSQADIYAVVSMKVITSQSGSLSSSGDIPYWLDDNISVGDKDISPLGSVNAQITNKETIESVGSNRTGFIIVKINAVKDRTGLYLYKNKPLLVSSSVTFNFPKSTVGGIVTYLDVVPPHPEYTEVLVKGHDMSVEEETAANLKIGSKVINNKGEVLVEVLEKRISPIRSQGLFYDARTGSFQGTENTTRVDVALTIRMKVMKIGNFYYFFENRKIKPDEFVYIPFTEVSLNFLINSVKEL